MSFIPSVKDNPIPDLSMRIGRRLLAHRGNRSGSAVASDGTFGHQGAGKEGGGQHGLPLEPESEIRRKLARENAPEV